MSSLRTPNLRILAALLATLSLAAGCAAAPEEDDVDDDTGAYTGGTLDVSNSGVGFLAVRNDRDEIIQSCTATLVTPKVLVTSKYCGRMQVAKAADPCKQLSECCAKASIGTRLLCTATAMAANESWCHEASLNSCEMPKGAKLLGMDVFFGVDPKKPGKGEKWIHVSDYRGEVGDLAVFSLESAAPTKPLPFATKQLSPSARWETARLVGYGSTEDSHGAMGGLNPFRSQDPSPRNKIEVKIERMDKESIRVDLGRVTSHRSDKGGPMIMKIDGVDTIVGIESQDPSPVMNAMIGSKLYFQRADAMAQDLAALTK